MNFVDASFLPEVIDCATRAVSIETHRLSVLGRFTI